MGWVGFIEAVWQRVGYGQLLFISLSTVMTVLGALYTFLTHPYHDEPKTLRGFVRFCLPARILKAQQTRLDITFAVVKKAVRFLYAWAFVSNLAFAYLFYNALCHLGHGAASAVRAATGIERALFLAVSIVVLDFFTFFAHYLEHKLAPMWQFHKVHHSALTLTPVTNRRFHPVEEVWAALWNGAGVGAWIALYAYAASEPLADATILGINAVILASAFSFHILRHSHIYMRYPLGLEHVLMSPAQHQIHHSLEERHLDRNFGLLFSCWDQLFGTIVYSEPMPATNLGLTERQEDYLSTGSLFFAPFIELAQKLQAAVGRGASLRAPGR